MPMVPNYRHGTSDQIVRMFMNATEMSRNMGEKNVSMAQESKNLVSNYEKDTLKQSKCYPFE